eukprot:1158940-Pelagomonas_calceolata.AAC.10
MSASVKFADATCSLSCSTQVSVPGFAQAHHAQYAPVSLSRPNLKVKQATWNDHIPPTCDLRDAQDNDLTKLRTQFQHHFSSAPPNSGSRLRDFMNQADVLGLAKHVHILLQLSCPRRQEEGLLSGKGSHWQRRPSGCVSHPGVAFRAVSTLVLLVERAYGLSTSCRGSTAIRPQHRIFSGVLSEAVSVAMFAA